MKKIYSLLTAVCVLFMVGCSDDDDDKNEINNNYDAKDVTLTGYKQDGVTAKFSSKDGKSGTVILTNLVPGEKESTVNVTVAQDAALANEYAIEGTSKNQAGTCEITIKGGAGAQLNLEVSVKSLSKAVGNWKPISEDQPFTLNLKITPENDTDVIDMCGLLGYNEVPLKGEGSFSTIIGGTIGMVFKYMVDFNVNLKDNSYLVASWAPGLQGKFKAGSSTEGIVSFNEVDKQLFIRINLSEIGNDPANRDAGGSGSLLLDLGTYGIPLKLDNADATGIKVSVTKDMITPHLTEIKTLLPGLLELFNLDEIDFPEGIEGITNENLGNFLPKVFEVIEKSKEFTIEINMQPA